MTFHRRCKLSTEDSEKTDIGERNERKMVRYIYFVKIIDLYLRLVFICHLKTWFCTTKYPVSQNKQFSGGC